jgi:hypothetical protein
MNASRSRVFISHASRNFRIADDIRRHLEALGVACWIAPRDIAPGLSYGQEITSAIKDCAAVLLVLTDEANVSRAVANELEMAFRHQRVIIPVRLKMVEPASSLAFFVNNAQWVDAVYTPLKQRVADIARIVQAVRDGTSPPPPPPERKTLLGSLERQLEGMIRYKLLTLTGFVAVLALLGAVGALSSSKVLSRMDADHAAVQRDPATYGLVTLSSMSEGGPEQNEIRLQAIAYMNLKEPAAAKVTWKAAWSRPGASSHPIDVTVLNALTVPGAQALPFTLPAQATTLSFCMAALHPVSGVPLTVRWDFVIDASKPTVSIQRASLPHLTASSSEDCQ